MEMKKRSFHFMGGFIAVLLIAGCNQSSDHRLLDQYSKDNPEYADFSDLPVPDSVSDQSDATGSGSTKNSSDSSGTTTTHPKPIPITLPGPIGKIPIIKTPTTLPQGGLLIPTVYYLPVYGDKRNCAPTERAFVKDVANTTLAELCRDEVRNCVLQGSCYYVDSQGSKMIFTYSKMVKVELPAAKPAEPVKTETPKEPKDAKAESKAAAVAAVSDGKTYVIQPRFKVNKLSEKCPQGATGRGICLDPYRSVAADLKIYKLGDVIYVPLLRGKKLPNNEIHDGYLVVRDAGGAINGVDRFDFYIGFDDYHGHLFTQLRLNDKKLGRFPYRRVPEDLAEKVRQARKFPDVPQAVRDYAGASIARELKASTSVLQMKEAAQFYMSKWLE